MANDILIVDDEADIRDLVAGILDDEGFRHEDLARQRFGARGNCHRRPHLVFLDIWLQGSKLDGLQLLEQIKKDHADVPVVMISGQRQYRDCGRGDQARRLRLHRKAFQVRPAHSGGDAGAGDLAPETRSEGTQATRAGTSVLTDVPPA